MYICTYLHMRTIWTWTILVQWLRHNVTIKYRRCSEQILVLPRPSWSRLQMNKIGYTQIPGTIWININWILISFKSKGSQCKTNFILIFLYRFHLLKRHSPWIYWNPTTYYRKLSQVVAIVFLGFVAFTWRVAHAQSACLAGDPNRLKFAVCMYCFKILL